MNNQYGEKYGFEKFASFVFSLLSKCLGVDCDIYECMNTVKIVFGTVQTAPRYAKIRLLTFVLSSGQRCLLLPADPCYRTGPFPIPEGITPPFEELWEQTLSVRLHGSSESTPSIPNPIPTFRLET